MPAPLRPRLLVLGWFAALTAAPVCGQVTESPYTVAPGNVLVEMDGLKLSLDRSDDGRYTALGIGSAVISAGLTSSLDVQAGVDLFLKETFRVGGARDSHSGMGDLALRMKWTFWRDEGRSSALAVIPYVKIPSGTGGIGSDAAEGGVILPWAMNLRGGMSAGAMFQWDVVRNDAEDGYDAHWHASGFVQQKLTSRIDLYGETTLVATSAGASKTAGTVGIGALYQVTKSMQLDYELQRGLNSRTPDWTHILRVNWGW